MGAKPTFLIIGAQKCGTTWLHQHLRQHPGVFMPAEKELEFFSYQGHLADPGFPAYLEHFPEAGQAHAVGEATASYFWTNTNSNWGGLPQGFQTEIPKTVQQHLGHELKLIVTLRNPVDRAVSAYLHYLAMGEITLDTKFEEAMTYGGIVDMGFYARHLRNWLEYYPLKQIKVLIMESDIRARPVETLLDICRFLGVSEHGFSAEVVQKPVYPGTHRMVNDEGVFVMDQDQHWHKVISAEQLEKLGTTFLNDVKDLDRILGTNLVDNWA
jgi:hypothetical protein